MGYIDSDKLYIATKNDIDVEWSDLVNETANIDSIKVNKTAKTAKNVKKAVKDAVSAYLEPESGYITRNPGAEEVLRSVIESEVITVDSESFDPIQRKEFIDSCLGTSEKPTVSTLNPNVAFKRKKHKERLYGGMQEVAGKSPKAKGKRSKRTSAYEFYKRMEEER